MAAQARGGMRGNRVSAGRNRPSLVDKPPEEGRSAKLHSKINAKFCTKIVKEKKKQKKKNKYVLSRICSPF